MTDTDGANQQYTIDPSSSRATFRAKAFGLKWVNGTLPVLGGSVSVTGGVVSGAVELSAAGVDTGIGLRDWHLRGHHYLAAAEHPSIHAEVEQVHADSRTAAARIVVRGAAGLARMDLSHLTVHDHILTADASGEVDRSSWPMLPRWAGVSTTVLLTVAITAIRDR